MIGMQIWSIAQADFKERTRRFSFLALCVLSALAAFFFVPNPDAEMLSIAVDAQYFSQATNETWIPMASALCTGLFLPVTGFFYLRNSLGLDRKSGVINLIHTSPAGRTTYLSGKYLSNLLILLCMLLVVMLASFGMAVLKFPGMDISTVPCFSYFLSIIPGIFLCAALALLAEAVWLFQSRTGTWMAGLIYFVLYIVCVSSLFDDTQSVFICYFDMSGILWLKDSIDKSVYPITGKPAQLAMFVHETGMEDMSVHKAGMTDNPALPELFFTPLAFTPDRILEKLCMIASGIALCAAASVLMPRYENTGKIRIVSEKKHRSSGGHGVFMTECILTFRNCSILWFLVMLPLWVSLFFADIETAQGILWVLSIAWSCVLFSDYGCREKKYNLNGLLPTINHAHSYQLLIRFFAGSIVSLLVSAPVIVRTAFISGFSGAAAGILFALFVPALSIFLGQASGSERLFEIVFLIICYVMLNTASFIRFSVVSGNAVIYCAVMAILTGLMLAVSCLLRG